MPLLIITWLIMVGITVTLLINMAALDLWTIMYNDLAQTILVFLLNLTLIFKIPDSVCDLNYMTKVENNECFVVALNTFGRDSFKIKIERSDS